MEEIKNKSSKKLKILLLLSESWNDLASPNNNLTNWFLDFADIEIRTVSGSGLLPNNKCCKDYFLVGEKAMMKSLFSRKRVGEVYHYDDFPTNDRKNGEISKRPKLFKETTRLIRDIVWRFGKYDLKKLKTFIEEFKPDLIFSQRKGSIKMCRLERLVSKLTTAPMVAYTGDDEYSLRQFSLSPVFWIRRFWLRAWLKKNIPSYKLFYSQSERQMQEFEDKFSVPTKFLVKCGNFDLNRVHRQVNQPIEVVYAGKLYCNRWKSLSLLAKEIKRCNQDIGQVRVRLNIYTKDKITRKINRQLNDRQNSFIHGSVSSQELKEIYAKSDIALHVEGFDLKNRLLTQDSFSTKVMDCLASGCAVWAICWEKHAAGVYLKKNDVAFVSNSVDEIQQTLNALIKDGCLVTEYAYKACEFGLENHDRKVIQTQFMEDFNKVIGRC